MPRNKDKGVDRTAMDRPCETCDSYRPFGGKRYGGECDNPNSPALYWESGGCWFTAPNDACSLWRRKIEMGDLYEASRLPRQHGILICHRIGMREYDLGILNDQWTILADREGQELSLINRETGETIYIPWTLIDELRSVQDLSR